MQCRVFSHAGKSTHVFYSENKNYIRKPAKVYFLWYLQGSDPCIFEMRGLFGLIYFGELEETPVPDPGTNKQELWGAVSISVA